jgi:uncharacterized membrane protein (DUF106 family)
MFRTYEMQLQQFSKTTEHLKAENDNLKEVEKQQLQLHRKSTRLLKLAIQSPMVTSNEELPAVVSLFVVQCLHNNTIFDVLSYLTN